MRDSSTVAPAAAAVAAERAVKVCIFTETYYPVIGGGETQARILADGLTEAGFRVFVLTRRSDATLPRTERIGGHTVHRLAPAGRGQLKKWGLLLSGIPALLRLRREYDIVFVSGFRIIGVAAVLVGRALGRHVVLKADSQGEMSGAFFSAGLSRIGVRVSSLPFRAFLGVRNAVLRRADAFAAITDDVAAELVAANVNTDTIHRIPNAVDTHRYFPATQQQKRGARQRLGLPEDARIVVYTGRLVTYKGLPLLLRVWSALQRTMPDAVLLLVGTGGLDIHACEEDLHAFVRDEGLERSVVFTGSVQNVHEYLHASDVFAFPSENDAFPSSLIEAMTSGLPVVATPVGAIPEIVRDEENGLLVEPGDHDGLLRALSRLLDDRELAARLGRSGWQTVQDRYSAERITQRYIEIFAALEASSETVRTAE